MDLHLLIHQETLSIIYRGLASCWSKEVGPKNNFSSNIWHRQHYLPELTQNRMTHWVYQVILLSNGTDSKMGIRLTSKMFWNSRDHEVKFCEGKNVLGRTSLDPFGLYFVIQYVLGDDKWWLCAILSKTYGCLQKEFYSSLFSTYFTTVCRRPAYCQKVNLRPQDFLMSSALNFINEKR